MSRSSDGHLALRWTVDAGRRLHDPRHDERPLPTSLPALRAARRGDAPIIDASSAVRPAAHGERTGTLVTQPVGTIRDAAEYAISTWSASGRASCAYSIGQPGTRLTSLMSSTIVVRRQDRSRESFSQRREVAIGPSTRCSSPTDSRTAWHVMIGVTGAAPSAPSATTEPPAARSPLGRPDEAILVPPDRWRRGRRRIRSR